MSDPLQPDQNFQVFDENAEIALKEISDKLEKVCPEGYGFVFLLAEVDKKGGATFYSSNLERSGVIATMQEFIDGQEDKGAA